MKACARCGTPFEPKHRVALYCGNACKVAAWRANNPARDRVLRAREVANAPPSSSPYFAHLCQCCRKPHAARTWFRYCSDACSYLGWKERAHRIAARVTTCDECGLAFCPLYGSSNATLCAPCADVRRRRNLAFSRQARKLRERTSGPIERVQWIDVAEAHGWRCYLCNVRTPLSARNTSARNAPTLDHEQPVGTGGPHQRANLHLACLDCNRRKGMRTAAQYLADDVQARDRFVLALMARGVREFSGFGIDFIDLWTRGNEQRQRQGEGRSKVCPLPMETGRRGEFSRPQVSGNRGAS